MKNVLVIGSTGQIGSELTMKLRSIYGGNIVAGYIPGAEPKGELLESGPSAIVDITNEQQIAETVSKYNIVTVSIISRSDSEKAWVLRWGSLISWSTRMRKPNRSRSLQKNERSSRQLRCAT